MNLAQLVKRQRDDRAMSLQDVATAAGCSKQYVSAIERGEVTNPSAKVIVGLAKALGLTRQRLLDAAEEGGF